MIGKRVYVAGALSNFDGEDERTPSKVVTDYIQNLNHMCRVAIELRRDGYYPYVPGMDFMLGLISGSWEEEDYRGIGMSFLGVCDAILVISRSNGVEREITEAIELGIPVYYGLDTFLASEVE